MKNLLLGALAASTVLCGAARAADMPVAVGPDVAIASASAYDWSGAYIGAHGGYAWGETDGDIPLVDDIEGFVIGGQLGYNFMLGESFLLGLEVDGSYSDQNAVDGGSDFDVNYLATVRGRLGFAFDRFLVFGTGGAAFAGADFVDSDDVDYFGWVAGGGVEYAITDNISFGVEYLHYEFGDEDIAVGLLTAENDLTTDVVRGRLNIKFDSILGR